MKERKRVIGWALLFLVLVAGAASAQESSHEALMSMLTAFFADPAARADYAAKNPEAMKAEQELAKFPPGIQRRLEKVVLMIMQESGANAVSHLDAANRSGPEGAFNSFSPAVQREIQDIARELEKDPGFTKSAGGAR
jgi:hypothetical protein